MFENLYLVFIIGFFAGVGFISLLFLFRKEKNVEVSEDTDFILLKNHMQSIQQSLQNFNLAQHRIENTLIRGGALQQGPWGEFVLKNILDSVGLREGEEYSTQKSFRDEEGKLQKPDVLDKDEVELSEEELDAANREAAIAELGEGFSEDHFQSWLEEKHRNKMEEEMNLHEVELPMDDDGDEPGDEDFDGEY